MERKMPRSPSEGGCAAHLWSPPSDFRATHNPSPPPTPTPTPTPLLPRASLVGTPSTVGIGARCLFTNHLTFQLTFAVCLSHFTNSPNT